MTDFYKDPTKFQIIKVFQGGFAEVRSKPLPYGSLWDITFNQPPKKRNLVGGVMTPPYEFNAVNNNLRA